MVYSIFPVNSSMSDVMELIESLQARPENFLGRREVMRIFRCSRSTIYRWLQDGRLESVRPGQRYLITKGSVIALLYHIPEPKEDS